MIITFSGTGNSMLVAKELQRHIGGRILPLEGDLLLSPSSQVLEVPEGEVVVWVFPIYSWGGSAAATTSALPTINGVS